MQALSLIKLIVDITLVFQFFLEFSDYFMIAEQKAKLFNKVIKCISFIFLLFERRYESLIDIIIRTMSFIREKINSITLRQGEDIFAEERPLKKIILEKILKQARLII